MKHDDDEIAAGESWLILLVIVAAVGAALIEIATL